MTKTKLKFDIEGRDLAFYTLYSALREYHEKKTEETKQLPKGQFLVVGAEAFVFLQDLKEQDPKEFEECEKAYNLQNPKQPKND